MQNNKPTLSDYKSKPGLKRIFNATKYSVNGFKAAFRSEAAFRQELLLCLVLVPLAFVLGENAFEVIFLLSTLFILLIIELFNSALEVLADRITEEHDEMIGRSKDIASAAVCLGFGFVAIFWIYFLFRRFL